MIEHYTYLDYAASAPLRPEAAEAERAYEASPIAGANPNSLHSMGREAAIALDGARKDLARCLGGGFRPSELIFTSGGTESNNLAVLGLALGARKKDSSRNVVVVSAIEHDSVLDLAPALHEAGFELRRVRPGRDGAVDPHDLYDALDSNVALVTVMYANNETGVVQWIPELADEAHRCGALFHTDAVQAFGRVPLSLAEVDAVSIAAHKIGGPVGVGALAVRGRLALRPLFFGGGQEQGKRAGTQDLRGALAFAAAAKACCGSLDSNRALVAGRAQALYDRLCAPGTGIVPTVSTCVDDYRLPGMVSVMVPGLDSETMILELDQAGFGVSAGSACSSGSLDPSHVLAAMGISRNDAFGALRVSFDERVSSSDLERFSDALLAVVSRHKKG